jgi:AcrR family transcriptional regulator
MDMCVALNVQTGSECVNIQWTAMADQKRKYRKMRRAEAEQRTRMRITESTVELHRTLGPAHTSVSAVARHAGVRRSTVYRHFPDEDSLFSACTSSWRASNPFPDINRWKAIDDSAARLTIALSELYAYYRRTERMMSNVLRDERTMPIVKRMLGGYRDYLDAARDALMIGRGVRGPARRQVLAAVGHALTYSTWHSLSREQGLTDSQAAGLMCRSVTSAPDTSARRGATRRC